jgi:hypothetical protein
MTNPRNGRDARFREISDCELNRFTESLGSAHSIRPRCVRANNNSSGEPMLTIRIRVMNDGDQTAPHVMNHALESLGLPRSTQRPSMSLMEFCDPGVNQRD